MKLATVLSYKPIDNDTRVKNQIKSLKSSGYKVEIIDLPSLNFDKENNISIYFTYLIDFFNFKKKILNINLKYLIDYSKLFSFKKFFTILSFIPLASFFYYKILKIFFKFLRKYLRFFFKFLRIFFKIFKISKNKFFRFFTTLILNNKFSQTLIKFIFVFIELKKRKKNNKPSLVVSNDLLTVPYGVYLKIKDKSKLIYDMHEYELHRIPLPSISKKMLLIIIEELFIPFTDVIFTVSYNIKKIYKKRFPQKKISLVLNAPSIQKYEIKNNVIKDKSKLKFIHVGNISYGRNIETLVNHFKKSNHSLTFLGTVIKKFDDEFNFFDKIKNYKNISHIPPVDPDSINEIVKEFDCNLFFYDTSIQNYNYALPNKFLLSLIENSPIICFKSKELLDFQKKFNVKLNLIKNISDLEEVDIFYPQISLKAKKYLSFQRQMKTIERYTKVLV